MNDNPHAKTFYEAKVGYLSLQKMAQCNGSDLLRKAIDHSRVRFHPPGSDPQPEARATTAMALLSSTDRPLKDNSLLPAGQPGHLLLHLNRHDSCKAMAERTHLTQTHYARRQMISSSSTSQQVVRRQKIRTWNHLLRRISPTQQLILPTSQPTSISRSSLSAKDMTVNDSKAMTATTTTVMTRKTTRRKTRKTLTS